MFSPSTYFLIVGMTGFLGKSLVSEIYSLAATKICGKYFVVCRAPRDSCSTTKRSEPAAAKLSRQSGLDWDSNQEQLNKKVCFGGRANPSPPMSHSCTTRDSGAISDKIRFERMLCVFSVYYHSFGLIRNSISNDHKNFREIPLLQSRLRPSPPLLHSYRRGGLPDEGI